MTASVATAPYTVTRDDAADKTRYLGSCAKCGYSVERSKRESAEHAVATHAIYAHDWQPS